jgi:hypothetical protein
VLITSLTASRRQRIKRLSARILDCARPDLLDVCDQVLRQRHVADVLGHLAAFGIGPGKELQRLADRDGVLWRFGHEDEGGADDGPRSEPVLIGWDDVETVVLVHFEFAAAASNAVGLGLTVLPSLLIMLTVASLPSSA